MTRTTVIHVVRHGEVENPGSLRYGRLPGFHLSADGRKQVEATVHGLARRPIQAIYTSPLERTQQTATLLSFLWPAVPLVLDGRLLEVKTAAQFEGHSRDRHFYYQNKPTADAETTDQIVGRLYHFLEEKIVQHNGQEIVAVSHGDPIALIYNKVVYDRLGIPEHFYPTYASVLSFRFDGLVCKQVWYEEPLQQAEQHLAS